MVKTWVYSDPHFHHANICKFENYDGTPLRPWDDVNQMNEDMIAWYNELVDDADRGVDQVVRGDDLASSTPRQMLLQRLLGLPTPMYAHVPLVLGPSGARLAKRDGAVTLEDLAEQGVSAESVRDELAASLGLSQTGESLSMAELLERFDPQRLPREAWVWSGATS